MESKLKIDIKPPSTNSIYGMGHWSKRKKIKDKWQRIFLTYIYSGNFYVYDKYEIIVKYRGVYDVDNMSFVTKMFVDALRSAGKTEDDSPEYFKKLTIRYDTTLNKNETLFIIREYDTRDLCRTAMGEG
jgi:hypothetical protein